MERALGIKQGETSVDRLFTLETVNCLGACALGPTVVVDNRYFRHVTTAKVSHIIEQASNGFQQSGAYFDDRLFPISVSCPLCGRTLMDAGHIMKGHPSIKLMTSFSGETAIRYLCALYGSENVDCDGEIPEGALTVISCPHCTEALVGVSDCPECGARMAMMPAGEYATLHLCPRHGCPGHRLDLTRATRDVSREGESA
jgi:(2Fe-2S) ferredoxin